MTSTRATKTPTRRPVRSWARRLDSWTLWAFNTQDVLNPHRRPF